jgi:hypothetical protein
MFHKQELNEESNEIQSIEMRPQNVIISTSSSNEGKIRPQDGSEDIQNSGVEISVGQIE